MQIISIVNQKGGVGKTTSTINIAAALAMLKYRVLTIDFDPQGNLSSGLGVGESLREKNIYNIILNEYDVNSCILRTKVEYLDIIPSKMDLAAFELDVVNKKDREFLLSGVLKGITIDYDYIFIDCPPSLGLLTVNALTSCDFVLIPVQCEYFALEGLSYLLETTETIKYNFNDRLKILGVLLTMYDKRNKLTEQIENDVRSCLGDLVFKSVIPRNVKLAECTSFGNPIIIYDKTCIGAIAYVNFVNEMVKKYDGKK
ncbi:MAG: AAA family ATPase [Rickettsiales bacterium]|jgi:chromosome partitioning protein|nr:AAA family ATPase [Rickettsiales bacterium]